MKLLILFFLMLQKVTAHNCLNETNKLFLKYKLGSSIFVKETLRARSFSFSKKMEFAISKPIKIGVFLQNTIDDVAVEIVSINNDIYIFKGPYGHSAYRLSVDRVKEKNVFFKIKNFKLEDIEYNNITNNMSQHFHKIFITNLQNKNIITLDLLKKIHRQVMKKEVKEEFLIAGILRGEKVRLKTYKNVQYEVNITHNEVGITKYSKEQGKQVIFAFEPPEIVLEKLTNWLNYVNEIKFHSSEEIFKILKIFIMIHPFSNGNGRVMRVLNIYFHKKYKIEFHSMDFI